MPTWLIIVLVILGVCALGILGYFLFNFSKKKREATAISPEEKELRSAEKEYAKMVKKAEKENAATIKALDKEVSSADKELEKAINGVNKVHGKYGQIRLYEDRVETPDGTAYFEEGEVEAIADTAGNIAVSQRITLTRLVAGGIIGGIIFPKKKVTDERELYLMVKTPNFASMVECKPDHGAQVRQFANNINNMCMSVSHNKRAREAAIEKGKELVEATKSGREKGISEANSRLDTAKQETSKVDAARQKVEQQ